MGRSLHVLVAEDNPVNQRVVQLLLERRGHRVELVADGAEAVAAVRRARFDLVLMDVQMPQMDGIEATRAIRLAEAGTDRHLPIVAMTAHAMKGDRERCLDAGMDDYVAKPVRSVELLRVIASALGAAGARSCPVTDETDDSSEPVLRRAAALERVDGDESFLQQLFDVLADDGPRRLEEIRAAIASGDAQRLQRTAHSLKGALECLCAERAAVAARRLEELGRGGDLSSAADVCSVLARELDRLIAAIDASAPTGR